MRQEDLIKWYLINLNQGHAEYTLSEDEVLQEIQLIRAIIKVKLTANIKCRIFYVCNTCFKAIRKHAFN